MERTNRSRESIALIVLASVLFGCYTTAHRGPKTVDPGQFSASGSYLRFKSTDAEPDDEPGEVVGVEGRFGLARGLDVGYTRTVDISEGVESDEGIDTHWMDAKVQFLNRYNLPYKPTASLGYGFGKVINSDETWVNTLYLSLGMMTDNVDLFYSFRYETLDDQINLMPKWVWKESFDDIRKAHVLGLEYQVNEHFKPVVEAGRFYAGDFGDGLNVFTLGVNIYGPTK